MHCNATMYWQTAYFRFLPFLAAATRFPLALLVVATLCLFFDGSEFSSSSGSLFDSETISA